MTHLNKDSECKEQQSLQGEVEEDVTNGRVGKLKGAVDVDDALLLADTVEDIGCVSLVT